MFNGTEAAAVAEDILAFVEMLKKKYRNSSVALKALRDVEKKIKEIKETGNLG